MMCADQLDQLPHVTFAVSSFFISSCVLVEFHGDQMGFCNTGSEVPVSMVIFVTGLVPMEVKILCILRCILLQ